MEQLLVARKRIHTHYAAASCRKVAHYSAYVVGGNGDLQLHDGFKQARLSLNDTFLESKGCCCLESVFVGVYRVV